MGSRVIQVALGLFLATFVYALLVLSGVDANQENGVPQISTVLTMALAVASFGWLIYFIHSLAAGIQVDNVIAEVANQVTKEVRRLGTRGLAQESRDESTAPDLEGRQPTLEVGAAASGYLQTLDAEGLVEVAAEADLLLEVLVRPGHFVLQDLTLVRVYGEVADAAALARRIRGLMVLGPRRTAAQDVEFSLNLLVEIAARALSPGVNDYYTALACVDHIAAALAALTRTGVPAAVRADGDGQVRVLLLVPSFSDFADAALDPLRQCARDNLPVSIRLLENLRMLAQCTRDPEVHRALMRHGTLIADNALAAARADKDREDVAERLADLQAVLEP